MPMTMLMMIMTGRGSETRIIGWLCRLSLSLCRQAHWQPTPAQRLTIHDDLTAYWTCAREHDMNMRPAPICDSIMHKYPPICWYSNGMFARWRKLWFGIWASISGQLYQRRRVFSDTYRTCGSGRKILDLACAYLRGWMTTATDQIVAVMRHKRQHAIGAYNYQVRKLSELGFSFYRYDFVVNMCKCW